MTAPAPFGAPVRLFLLTALTMCAFAANSVLNRLAIAGGRIGPFDFAVLRLVSGALALWLLACLRGRKIGWSARRRLAGGGALLVYMLGFSWAYLELAAGTGALLLFGGVQITMFAGALAAGDGVPARRWLGAGLAMSGLVWLLWPQGGAGAGVWPALSMGLAAVGWGVYSLIGRREGDPLAATAANFIVASPVALAVAVLMGGLIGGPVPGAGLTAGGAGLAVLSGVVTSGMGYALWYRILPALGATRAAVAQLTVPVIAAAGGMALLGERPDLTFALATALVLGGVAIAALPRRG